MNPELSAEATEYGRTARRALEAAGGDDLVQRAEAAADGGAAPAGDGVDSVVAAVLGDLGAWDLDPRSGGDELEAAAALCRSAGWWAVPHPVAERLARPAGGDADALAVVADVAPAVWDPAPGLRWAAVSLDGRRRRATAGAPAGPARKAAFVAPVDLAPAAGDGDGAADVPLALVLPCWTLLGMLDRALALTTAYVRDRHQFGQPLASFQGVQFQLTDAETERVGLEALAHHALWSAGVGGPDALVDALALRLAALEAAEVVFRVTHQLHGAIGFCDVTTLSWLSRYSLPLRRLPLGLSAVRDELSRRLGDRGLAGLFG